MWILNEKLEICEVLEKKINFNFSIVKIYAKLCFDDIIKQDVVTLIRDNVNIIRDFFRLVKGSKKWIFLLFFGSIMAHLSSLLIPIFTSNIIYEVTKSNVDATYINIGLLAITYVAYNLFWYLNYISYSFNFKYSYKNLRERIVDKVFTYDSEFSDKLSKGTILNTVNTDTANLSEMIDNVCEIMVVFVKVIIMIFIFLKTNIYIGLIVLLLESL